MRPDLPSDRVEEFPSAGADSYREAGEEEDYYEEVDDSEEEESRGGGLWYALMALLLGASVLGAGAYGVVQVARRGYLDQFEFLYRDVRLLPSRDLELASAENTARVYYVQEGRVLAAAPRRIRRDTPDAEKARLLLRELLAPSGDPHLSSALPPGVEARGLYQVGPVAYVDLGGAFQQPENPTPRGERLAVYSIVNTLSLEIPGIEAVQILVEGSPVKTAWGWLDLTSPLAPDLSLVQ